MQKNLSNKELVAAGHKFAANISADTPLIDMAKMVSALATQLDAALAAAAEACKQRDMVATENASLKKSLITIANSERFDGDSFVCDFDSLVSVAAGALSTPATEAYLNAVRAEGVESFAHQQRVIADATPDAAFQRHRRFAAGLAEDFAAQLRGGNAGKDGV